MKVIIIEDELLAQAKLEGMLVALNDQIEVIAKIGSVKDALAWLRSNHPPHLAFVDIQLSDDHSFEIFRQCEITFPVIFTTAYDKYLLESFEFNSIDYLLKPVTEEKLKRSLDKVKKLELHFAQGNISNLINPIGGGAKERIIGKRGNEFVAIGVDEVAYFYTEHKIVFVRDHEGRQFIVDKTLAELEAMLDFTRFFRLNRKFIASVKSLERFKPDNGKIKVFLKPASKEEVFVSKESAPEFRSWIKGV